MNRVVLPTILAALAVAHSHSAAAQRAGPIPLIISWDGEQPGSITYLDEDGTTDVPRNPDGVFRRDIPRPAATMLYSRRTILVRYRDHTIPLVINVRPTAQKIEFHLSLTVPKSCYEYYLRQAEMPPTNADDAMRRTLAIAYMLEIPGNDGCEAIGFEPRAKRVRLDRNANLSASYQGLIAINDAWRRAVTDLPAGSLPNTTPATVAYNADKIATTALLTDIYRDNVRNAASPGEAVIVADRLIALRNADPTSVAANALSSAPLDKDRALYTSRKIAIDASAATAAPP
jgi:hypothetical protein